MTGDGMPEYLWFDISDKDDWVPYEGPWRKETVRYAYCPPGYRVVKDKPDECKIPPQDRQAILDRHNELAIEMLAASSSPSEEK